jgi:hypothetical protein
MANKFYGKYRGKVANNIDPMNLGRVQVTVPSVFGTDQLSWAMPCVPYAGPQVGFFMLPNVNTSVWVEFEGGDPCYPVWTGCFWETGELPAEATSPAKKLIKTTGTLFKLDDTPAAGGVQLNANSSVVKMPLTVKLDNNGLLLDASPATLQLASENVDLKLAAASVVLSNGSVNLNQGALEVS